MEFLQNNQHSYVGKGEWKYGLERVDDLEPQVQDDSDR